MKEFTLLHIKRKLHKRMVMCNEYVCVIMHFLKITFYFKYFRTHKFQNSTVSILPSGEGSGTPLQYSCLENPMDGGAWWAGVHGVTKSWTRLSDFTFPFHFHALEKDMAIHSSVLAWRIPGTGEPGGLTSMGSHSQTQLKRLSSSSSILLLVFLKDTRKLTLVETLIKFHQYL